MFAIKSLDKTRQIVFGYASVAKTQDGQTVIDYDGEYLTIETLEDAVYPYVLEHRTANERHRGGTKGELVESFVITREKLVLMGLAEDALPLGWWVGYKIYDADVFAKVEAGIYKMFSIEGRYVPD